MEVSNHLSKTSYQLKGDESKKKKKYKKKKKNLIERVFEK